MEPHDNHVEFIDPFWHLVDPLTVRQAAALIAGSDPNFVQFDAQGKPSHFEDETGLTGGDGIQRVRIAFAALMNAITDGKLKAQVRHSARVYGYTDAMADIDATEGSETFTRVWGSTAEDDETLASDHSCFYKEFPDWNLSTVSRHDLIDWLSSKGFRSGFFFPDATDAPDYLDRHNPRYAQKLAAAVRAWQAVTDPPGISPKQALMKWLRQHAAEFGLSDDEGRPNETGIEEAAKVANWQSTGGAPKTPGE